MIINTEQAFKEMLGVVKSNPVLVYDTETTGLKPYQGDRVIGMSMLVPGEDQDLVYYLPFRHRVGINLPIHLMYRLAPVFADPQRALIGFNLKYDTHITTVEGMVVFNQVVDVMLGAHLANENEMSFALKKLGYKYLGSTAAVEEAELDKLLKERGLKKNNMDELPPEMVAPYAEKDVILTWGLALKYQEELERQGLTDLWAEVNAYSQAITVMEKNGVLIDPAQCLKNMENAAVERVRLLEEMTALVGHTFNPNSVPQLQVILGQQITDKEALATCAHPVAPLLLQFRGWDRAINSYYKKFLELRDDQNRIHPNINLHGTISGRLSCTEPNLQALPKKKDRYFVRDLVIAPPGFVLVSIDWSQVELRLLTHYTRNPFLMDTYQNNRDIHQATADQLGIDRESAKRINYSIVYGIGANGLSNDAGIPLKQAQAQLKAYHSLIPEIKKLQRATEDMAMAKKKIPMWTGRFRHFREADETHKAMSNLIQGGVAEMMRIAMTNLHQMLIGTRVRMILQVHDELLFEVPENEVAHWYPKLKAMMEDFDFRAPILAEGKIGSSWRLMKSAEEVLRAPESAPEASGVLPQGPESV
jgi:DNA polymerase-1